MKVKERVTVFKTGPKEQTSDFNPGDIRYIKESLGHYVENMGDEEAQVISVFKSDRFAEVSLSDWLTHAPPEMVRQTLNISQETLSKFPVNRPGFAPF